MGLGGERESRESRGGEGNSEEEGRRNAGMLKGQEREHKEEGGQRRPSRSIKRLWLLL